MSNLYNGVQWPYSHHPLLLLESYCLFKIGLYVGFLPLITPMVLILLFDHQSLWESGESYESAFGKNEHAPNIQLIPEPEVRKHIPRVIQSLVSLAKDGVCPICGTK